jgi:hypothetical protein
MKQTTNMKTLPWPDGLDVAQMTFFAPPTEGNFAPNVIVQLRTDAGELDPGSLADRDLGVLRDSGANMHSLDRKISDDGTSARLEYVFDGPGGEKLRQIMAYFSRTVGVYSVGGTLPAGGPAEQLRVAIDALVKTLSAVKE